MTESELRAEQFAVAHAAWDDLSVLCAADGWVVRLEAMRAEQARIRAGGGWTSGPRTLLGALRLQNNEVLLTRALAWLMRPDGAHGLGAAALDAVAQMLELAPVTDTAAVQVVVEESRVGDSISTQAVTRADLVVYTHAWTLVVEAKVFAPEQPDQLDRLHTLWADEIDPTFVYLTRGHRVPTSAPTSAGDWVSLTWSQLAAALRAATGGLDVPSGVAEYLETLEAFHHE